MELGNQFGLAIILAYALQALKRSSWFPLLTQANSTRYKAVLGGVVAFLATVGIHYTFDHDPAGHGILTIALPTAADASHALFDFAKQWALQQGVYDGWVSKGTLGNTP